MGKKPKKKTTKRKKPTTTKTTTSRKHRYMEDKKEESTLVVLPITEAHKIPGVADGTTTKEHQFKVYRYYEGTDHLFVKADSFKDLHKGLLQAEEREEQQVEINFSIPGYPLDIIVQVNRAMDEIHGFTHARDRISWLGSRPPMRLNIKTGLKTSVEVVYGEMAPPAWESGSLHMSVDELSLHITGIVKRKFEPEVKKIVELTEHLVKTQSIYKGQAVEWDLSWVESGEFDPGRCAPEFIDVSKPINLILSEGIERQLETHLWGVIRKPQNYRDDGTPIKTGISFVGDNGTGKTLCCSKTAQEAMWAGGWTYLFLRRPITPKTFLTFYKMAQLYSPSIPVLEDCDVLFAKERDAQMNELLETLDGITAKNSEVISIYTTNFPRKLVKAFRRGGRVNHEIVFTTPDAKAAARFVQYQLGEFLAPDVDFEAVGEKLANLVQSEITNVCDSAKKYRRREGGDDTIIGKINTEDLLLAGEEVWQKVLGGEQEVNPHKVKLEKIQEGFGAMAGTSRTDMEVIQKDMAKLKDDLKKIGKGVGVNLK
jgi:hypothetical protein